MIYLGFTYSAYDLRWCHLGYLWFTYATYNLLMIDLFYLYFTYEQHILLMMYLLYFYMNLPYLQSTYDWLILLMIDLFYLWFYLWLTYSTYDLLIRLSINLSYLWLTSSTYDLLMIYLSIWALIYPTYDSLILLRTVVGTGIFRSSFVLFIDNALPSTCPQGYRPCPRRACTARQILRAGSKIAVDDVLKASANDLHFLVGMHQPARNN